MWRFARRWLAGVGMVWLGTTTGVAFAQSGIGSTSTMETPGSLANPYNNPHMNPFLNPYATMNPAGRNGTMMYFLAARQQQQAELAAAQAAASTPSAPTITTTRGVPAGAASRYFQRTVPVPGSGHYQRYNQYYSGIGR